MSDMDTFTLLPLQIDPQTKAISTASGSRTLQKELEALNSLHRALLGPEATPQGVPPPPMPVNPKRTANVTKLRESGNAEQRKGRHAEAAKLYGLGLQMALARPSWEPRGLVAEEVAGLYANRAQALMALGDWPAAAVDAEASVEAKRVANPKAWWRRGKCLAEMGRLREAREWVRRALETEGDEPELRALLADVEARIEKGSAEKGAAAAAGAASSS
ncbi:putative translocation protein sec72 [Rosellinia necatrix]|uniref:Putative translocation protein sec72 n=1 Tax=Rosellinia necatrix TaxID=77044 RepID=A0A1W2TVY9_ROSNE|nr:putative translocation protein sec72 [Rosellinia necatrix]